MWSHYKKTALAIQSVITLFSLSIWVWSHNPNVAGLFFAVMQFSALLGAGWAARFKSLEQRGQALRALKSTG